MNKYWVAFYFMFLCGILFSQDLVYQKQIDSLKIKLSKTTNDTTKIETLNTIGQYYTLEENSESYSFYTTRAIAIAKKINFWEGIIAAYDVETSYYNRKGDKEKERQSIQKMFDLAAEKKDDRLLGLAHFYLGNYSWGNLKENNEVLDNYNRALQLFRKKKDKHNTRQTLLSLAIFNQDILKNYNQALKYYEAYLNEKPTRNEALNVYLGIGLIYANQNKYKEAIKNFEKIVLQLEQEKKTFHMGYAHTSEILADIYVKVQDYDNALRYYNKAEKYFEKEFLVRLIALKCKKSNLYRETNDISKATKTLNEALILVTKLTDCTSLSSSYSNIANEFQNQLNYANALTYFLKAYNSCEEAKSDKFLAIDLQTSIGYNYMMLAKNPSLITADYPFPTSKYQLLQLSLEYFQKSLKNLERSQNYSKINNIYYMLSEVHELSGNHAKAYDAFKNYVVYKDSLDAIENRELLVQNQMQFEFDQKEKLQQAEQEKKDALSREELTKEKNNRNIALGGIAFFVVVAGFSGFAYVQKRKDNKIISEQKQKSDDLLLNILPAEIAKELKEKGTSEAKHFESVSIMFTDFKDFTKLSETIPSTELIQELNYCFKEFDNIISKHGVEKIKTIGDSYMAVCGLPAQYGNHAQKMVDAALEIRDFIEFYKESRQKQGKSFFEMRIGINSGEVVAGIVGIKKFAYDIWGDAVNTASRMESNGVIGKVNISEATYNLVKEDFSSEYRGEMDAKGKGKIKMYFVEPIQDRLDFEKAKEFILEKLERELPTHLKYHNVAHILDVFQASLHYAKLEELSPEETTLLKTASLFHDSGFIIQAANHEVLSCNIAEESLPNFGYNAEQIQKIKGMIMATRIPQTPTNHLEEILADADLDYLGRDDFEKISERLFQELNFTDRNEWNKIQISFFEKHHYFTESAKRLRNIKKQENLQRIISQTKV